MWAQGGGMRRGQSLAIHTVVTHGGSLYASGPAPTCMAPSVQSMTLTATGMPSSVPRYTGPVNVCACVRVLFGIPPHQHTREEFDNWTSGALHAAHGRVSAPLHQASQPPRKQYHHAARRAPYPPSPSLLMGLKPPVAARRSS